MSGNVLDNSCKKIIVSIALPPHIFAKVTLDHLPVCPMRSCGREIFSKKRNAMVGEYFLEETWWGKTF